MHSHLLIYNNPFPNVDGYEISHNGHYKGLNTERKFILNNMIKDFELTNNIRLLFDKNVIFYGAGNTGQKIMELLEGSGITISAFCDSDPDKWGTRFYNYTVLSPDDLMSLDSSNVIVIVTSLFQNDIIRKLNEMGFLGDVATAYSLLLGLYINIHDMAIPKSFSDMFSTLSEKYINTRRLIASYDKIRKGIWDVKPDSVLIYQPGKVGSTTLVNSIRRHRSVSHVHSLDVDYLGVREYDVDYFLYTLQMYQDKGKTLKVITGVREPIIRAVSAFFQSLIFLIKPGVHLHDLFNQVPPKFYLDHKHNEYGYFGWFDNEMKKMLDIDIFSFPFSQDAGYNILKVNNVELFIYKLEKLNSLKTEIGTFLDIPQFEFLNDNVGNKKPYSYLYRGFLESFKVNSQLSDLYYNSNPYMNHFYSKAERNQFLNKWNII